MATKKRKPPADVPVILESFGIESICDELLNGETFTKIARKLGIARSALKRWIDADEARSARAREARIDAASAWDEKAEDCIELAGDPFELQRARELAHHYRWRASKIAPADYGDKKEPEKNESDVNILGGMPD
jgi:hypothetical protein